MKDLWKLKRYVEQNIGCISTFEEMLLLCEFCSEVSEKRMEQNKKKHINTNKYISPNYKAAVERKRKKKARRLKALAYIADTGKCPCSPMDKCPCDVFIKTEVCGCAVFNQDD